MMYVLPVNVKQHIGLHLPRHAFTNETNGHGFPVMMG